jgi:PEP-CTERM motif
MKKFLATSALALALCSTSASAAVLISGQFLLNTSATSPSTLLSPEGAVQFKFTVDDSPGVSTAAISGFEYKLDGNTVAGATATNVTFFDAANGGMFDLTVNGKVLTFYGAGSPAPAAYDIGSTGTINGFGNYFPVVFALDSFIDGSKDVGLGLITVKSIKAAVPEPGTWGMMLLGFGLVGMAMRRGQNVRVSFA